MKECMPVGKPQISILMAVYDPHMDWLRQQLESLNAQTYSNLRLYICDDCSPTVSYAEIQSLVKDCISAFPYKIWRNNKNIGSNGTFEQLTLSAEGDLFAYCDQDDIWLPEKLAVLEREISKSGALLVCSDMFVIDGEGQQMSDSIRKVRRHHVFRSGDNLAIHLLFSNFVTGCTMLVQSKEAKAAVPFCPYMVHDHYLALWCAEHGQIQTVTHSLIRYRIHGGNQTGIMSGVFDKTSYGTVRIEAALNKMLWLKAHFLCGTKLSKTIDDAINWLQARRQNWNHQGGAATVWKYRHFSVLPSIAEICMEHIPDKLFMKAIELVRKNWI